MNLTYMARVNYIIPKNDLAVLEHLKFIEATFFNILIMPPKYKHRYKVQDIYVSPSFWTYVCKLFRYRSMIF